MFYGKTKQKQKKEKKRKENKKFSESDLLYFLKYLKALLDTSKFFHISNDTKY